MISRHKYYMRDPRLRPQDAEFATLASKNVKRAFNSLKTQNSPHSPLKISKEQS